MMNCKICSSQSTPFATAVVLGKYNVQYFECQACGFIQTEEPYWLAEAYSPQAISPSDLGVVSRNVTNAKLSMALITAFFDSSAKFIDIGGGYGLLVRLMRDAGYNFFWSDRACVNLFAKGTEADLSNGQVYELATAFEVLEHLVSPREEIKNSLELSSSLFFSTFLVPKVRPRPNEWWYYQPQDGQHICFYTLESLNCIADKFHVHLYSDNRQFHLLTRKRISPYLFRKVLHSKLGWVLRAIGKRKSLLEDDYLKLTGKGFH
jgi:hypothetical protein